MVYKIRVILNTEEDAIRDIAISRSDSLEDLHNAITNAFGFAGDEMASFYRSDDTWVQGEEHPLFDMSEGHEKKVQMSEVNIDSALATESDKMIYVYDFFNMWFFYVELIDSNFDHNNIELPNLLFSLGTVPMNAPELNFETEKLSDDDFEEDTFEELDDDLGDFSFN